MLSITSDFLSAVTLNFDLNQKHDFTPKSESIKKYVDSEVEKVLDQSLIDDKDVEFVSFKPIINYTFTGYFKGAPSYTGAGFSTNYIVSNTLYKDESFYLFDLYDNYVDNNQNLISRNFAKMSKIVITEDKTDLNFQPNIINKEYVNIYIPSYFIATTADTFYFKISFFNATNGKLRFFECSTNDTGSLKNYFKLKLNKTNKTYEILNGSGNLLVNTPQSKTYRISEVIESIKESKITDQSSIPRIRPLIKTKTTITARGTFV
jgi:hypothetical protein